MTKIDGRSLRKLLKAAIEAVAPDLRKTMALPRKAKVTAVKPAGGTYVCSVQPVLNDGRPDPAAPVIPEVEIPCVWAGPDRGLICPPTVGEYCDLGFYDGDPNSPFIMSFRPSSAPAAELDELMIQHSPGIRLGFKADGTVIVEAPRIEARATEHIKAEAATAEVKVTQSATVEAGAEINLTAPVVNIEGHLKVSGGISAMPGKYGSNFELRGHLRIIEGGLDAQGDVTSDSNQDFGSTIPDYIHDEGAKANRLSLAAEAKRRVQMDSRVLAGSVASKVLKWAEKAILIEVSWRFWETEEPQNLTITLKRPAGTRVTEDVNLADD